MSSSERSSSGESDDESLPDLQKLKPYYLEPKHNKNKKISILCEVNDMHFIYFLRLLTPAC